MNSGTEHGKCSPDIMIEIEINELVICNTNPGLLGMRVLKTIPSDSPELIRQNETRTITKCIDTVG